MALQAYRQAGGGSLIRPRKVNGLVGRPQDQEPGAPVVAPKVAPSIAAPTPARPPAIGVPQIAPRIASPAIAPTMQPPPVAVRPPVAPAPTRPAVAPAARPAVTPGVQPTRGEQQITEFGPGDDLRSAQINPLGSERLSGYRGMTDAAARRVAGFTGTPAYRRVGPESYGGYTDAAGRNLAAAERDIGQVGVGQYGAIAPTDISGFRQGLRGAQQTVEDARLGPFERIGTTDLSGYGQRVDEATAAARGAGIPAYRRIDPTGFAESRGLLQEAGTLSRGGDLPAFEGVATGTYAPSAEAGRARTLTAQGLESLIGAPSRQDLALETFRRLEGESVPETQAAIRSLGQRAAALGRTGSGMVTEEAGDIFGARKLKLENIKKELASETAAQELNDRLNRLQATQGVAGQLSGEDLARAGFEQGLRGETRGERGALLEDAQRRAALGLQRGEAVRGLAGDVAGLEEAARGQEVGERGFETEVAGQRAGLDLARSGQLADLAERRLGAEQARRGELVGEREAGTALASRAADLALSRGQTLAGLAGQGLTAERGQREEAVGERGFQSDLEARRAALAAERAGLRGTLAGEQFGVGQALRGEERGEREAELNRTLADLEARRGVAGDLFGMEQGLAGREAGQREELRGERAYQGDLAAKAQQDRINQRLLEEDLLNSAFGRNLQRSQFDVGLAENEQAQAGQSEEAVQALIASLLQRKRQQEAVGGA